MDGLSRVIHHLTQAAQALQEHAKAQQKAAPPTGALARRLASQGRGGDTMLAHINPREAQKLKQDGGAGTINPHTGLPEFYDVGPGGSNEGGGYDASGSAIGGGGGINDAGGGSQGMGNTGGLGDIGGSLGFSPDQLGMAGASSTSGVAGATNAGLSAATGGMAGLGSGIGGGVTPSMAPYSRTALDKIVGMLAPGFTGFGSPTAVQSGIVGAGRGLIGSFNPGMSLLNAIDTISGGQLSAHGDKGPAGYGQMSSELAGQGIDPAVLAAINGGGTG